MDRGGGYHITKMRTNRLRPPCWNEEMVGIISKQIDLSLLLLLPPIRPLLELLLGHSEDLLEFFIAEVYLKKEID